jgi:hypothetical protein
MNKRIGEDDVSSKYPQDLSSQK